MTPLDINSRATLRLLLIVFIFSIGGSRVVSQTADPTLHLFMIDAARQVSAPETGYLEMGSDSAGKSPDGSTLAVNSRYLLLDGRPWLPVMGEFHFTRCPRQYWEEEILKMKAGGIQVISTYVFWIHHEEIEGRFDWSGQRDLRAFVTLCARHGLYVYPRIGPWAHGEARNGGFPDWLLTKGPTRVNDSTFLFSVRTLYGEIGKQLRGLLWKDGGPVIGIQIENEYANGSANAGESYLLNLKHMAREAGLDVPLYTVTGWDNAVIPAHAFIPVYGGYPDEAWSGSTRELPPDPQGVFQFHVATPVGTAGIMQGAAAPAEDVDNSHYPRFTAELGGGMEDTYHRRVVVSPNDVASMALTALGSGVNLVGYYMFHGGTNPDGKLTTLQESQETGYPNDVPVKSYDFQAPLGEFGQMNGSFRKLKVIHQFIHDFGVDLAPMQAARPDVVPSGPRDTTTLRVSARTAGDRGFLFFNNYLRNYPLPEQRNVQIRLELPSDTMLVPKVPFDAPSQTCFIWPVNMNMDGVLVKYATAQPLAKLSNDKGSTYFFTAAPKPNAEFVFGDSTITSIASKTGKISRAQGRIAVHGVAPSRASAIEVESKTGKEIRVILLSEEQSLNSWKLRLNGREYLLISPADVFIANDTVHLRSRNPRSFQLWVYPGFAGKMSASAGLTLKGKEGIFTHYVAPLSAIAMTASVKEIRKPTTVPPVKMGKFIDWRNCAVASSPDDSTFDKAGLWHVTLPKRIPAGVSEVFLTLNYAGDIARLYEGNRLLDDNFFNGTPWDVGLKRFGEEIRVKGVELSILPLRKDAPIYLPKSSWPSFDDAQCGKLKSVRLTPEYEVTLSIAKPRLTGSRKFLLGADISFLAAPGRGRYALKRSFQEHGKQSDELTILVKHGWTCFRLRVFVSPVRDAPDNSLENTIPLAKRIKAAGASFGLDFHFSDTWADPQHQEIPVAWTGLSFDQLEDRVETYTRDVIAQLRHAGAAPDWVQIGNEITRGTLWPLAQVQIPGSTKYNPPEPYDEVRQWDHLTGILKAAVRGVRAAAGDSPPRIVIHIDQGGNWPATKWFFDHLEAAGVDYDVIAESFYPEWRHGTLEGLWANMLHCANRYGKEFLVAESGYDSSRVKDNEDMLWPVTSAGRLQFMADIISTVRSAPNGIGVLYWAPERGVWNDDGSPGPTVFVLDSLTSLMRRPQSHVPSVIVP